MNLGIYIYCLLKVLKAFLEQLVEIGNVVLFRKQAGRFREAQLFKPQMPHTRLVYLADREADMEEMMRSVHEMGPPANRLVRAKHDGCLARMGKSCGTSPARARRAAKDTGE
jgi:hypothetical protein